MSSAEEARSLFPGLNPPPPVFDIPPPPPLPPQWGSSSPHPLDSEEESTSCQSSQHDLQTCDSLAGTFDLASSSSSSPSSSSSSKVWPFTSWPALVASLVALFILAACVTIFILWRRHRSEHRLSYLRPSSSSSSSGHLSNSSSGMLKPRLLPLSMPLSKGMSASPPGSGGGADAALLEQPLIYDDHNINFIASTAAAAGARFVGQTGQGEPNQYVMTRSQISTDSIDARFFPCSVVAQDLDNRIYEEVRNGNEDHYSSTTTTTGSGSQQHQQHLHHRTANNAYYSRSNTLKLSSSEESPYSNVLDHHVGTRTPDYSSVYCRPAMPPSGSSGGRNNAGSSSSGSPRYATCGSPFVVQNRTGVYVYNPQAQQAAPQIPGGFRTLDVNQFYQQQQQQQQQAPSSTLQNGSKEPKRSSSFLSSLLSRKKARRKQTDAELDITSPTFAIPREEPLLLLEASSARLQAHHPPLQPQQIPLHRFPPTSTASPCPGPRPSTSRRRATAAASNNNQGSSCSSSSSSKPPRVRMPDPDDILPREAWTDFSGRDNWSQTLQLKQQRQKRKELMRLRTADEDDNGNPRPEDDSDLEDGSRGASRRRGDNADRFYYCQQQKRNRRRRGRGQPDGGGDEADLDDEDSEQEPFLLSSSGRGAAADLNGGEQQRRSGATTTSDENNDELAVMMHALRPILGQDLPPEQAMQEDELNGNKPQSSASSQSSAQR